MVNSTNSILPTSANTDLLASSTSTPASSTGSTEFADTLATCMFFPSASSAQSGSPSGNSSQNGFGAATATLTAAATAATATLMNAAPVAATPAATPTPAASTTTTSPAAIPQSTVSTQDLANMTPDQAYWASQPPAVQALQNMPLDQRYAAAQGLANQGYTIDVPIMVWGMDPAATMVVRQNDGETWVPSAMQPDIPVAPGDSFPGMPSYDPNNPPAGSIQVTTAFAAGTNGQDPWVTQAQLAASEAAIS
jgi:hypothetical protein